MLNIAEEVNILITSSINNSVKYSRSIEHSDLKKLSEILSYMIYVFFL